MTDDLISHAAALLPCPFCGGKNIGWEYRSAYSTDSSYAFFGCLDCQMGSDSANENNRMCPHDVKQWNTRALPAVAVSQTPNSVVKADSQQSVRVKPLVWEGDTIVCTTALILREGGVCLDRDKADQFERERADEILSLLETQPDPRDEVIAGLMEALAFYADKSTYETQYERMPCDCCTDIFEPINDDKGSKARAAIAAAKQLIVRC